MSSFTDSIAWKSFIIKFGGIASAVVIVGALFKIQHWPGASIMITIGMSSEVVIFLLSALDTFHPDVDWSVVYPELAEHGHAEKTQVVLSTGEEPTAEVATEKELPEHAEEPQKLPPPETKPVEAEKVESKPVVKEQVAVTPAPTTTAPPQYQYPPMMPTMGLDMSKLDIDVSAISEGMKKFGENIGNLDAFAETAAASRDLTEKIQGMTSVVDKFTEDYGNSTYGLAESAAGLTTAYQTASENIVSVGRQAGEIVTASGKQMAEVTEDATKILAENYRTITENINSVGKEACEMVALSGQDMATVVQESTKALTENYHVVATNIGSIGKQVCESVAMSGKQLSQVMSSATDSFAETFTLIDKEIRQNLSDFGKNNNDYNKSLTNLNKNMSALNTAYELQVQEVVKYQKKSSEVGQYMESFVAGLEKSAAENLVLHKELAHLNTNIAELNNIYGSMLSAVQVVTKKK